MMSEGEGIGPVVVREVGWFVETYFVVGPKLTY